MIRALTFIFTIITSAAQAVEIQEITSPGGVEAWLVEDHSIPFVAIEMAFDGGASLDRPGKRGAGYLMSGLIEEGAGDMDAQAFQTAREALAADFGFDIGDDRFTVSARMLTENRDQAVDLLRQALTAPRFDQDAIDRVRAQVIAGIRSSEKDPGDIARAAFYAQTFGDHPYATAMEGTVDSVTALTRDDLVQAHRDLLVRGRVHVSAVGDITADELGALVDDLLGALPETGPELPGLAHVNLPGTTTVVDFPTPQSVAFFAQPGLSMDDPDFFAAYILNTILGGHGPQSRLMEEVREKRGLTYGIGSYLVDRDGADIWLGQVASGNATINQTVDVVRNEWARLARGGVTQDELDRAKTYLTGAYPLRFDGNGPIAGILTGMQIMGRTPDYINTRNARVEAVTLDQVNALAAQLMAPDKLTFVIAGQPVE